jgi:hypothetical protein
MFGITEATVHVDVGLSQAKDRMCIGANFHLSSTVLHQVHFTSGKFSAYDDAISEPGPNLPVDGSENICCGKIKAKSLIR